MEGDYISNLHVVLYFVEQNLVTTMTRKGTIIWNLSAKQI